MAEQPPSHPPSSPTLQPTESPDAPGGSFAQADAAQVNVPALSQAAASYAPAHRPPPPSLLEELWELALWVGGFVWQLLKEVGGFLRWCAANPVAGVALVGIAFVFYWFYAVVHPFVQGSDSTARWAFLSWNSSEQSYGQLVPLIALGLLIYHRERLRAAPAGGYRWGLVPLLIGITLFVLANRSVNPRMSLGSIPFLFYGGVYLLGGRAAARVLLFPSIFLFFMIPVAALEQATLKLQFIITAAVGGLSQLLGVKLLTIGTTITVIDGAFNFEIAEGCSGIRSLTAMMMLTAVFVHLTQDRLWKKVLIFSGSLLFAIIGNIGRVFSIVLLARFYDPKLAAGLYHDYSGFLFFPIAILAMVLFARLVNLDFAFFKKRG